RDRTGAGALLRRVRRSRSAARAGQHELRRGGQLGARRRQPRLLRDLRGEGLCAGRKRRRLGHDALSRLGHMFMCYPSETLSRIFRLILKPTTARVGFALLLTLSIWSGPAPSSILIAQSVPPVT